MSWSSSTTRTRIPSRTSLSLCSPGLVAWGPESGSSTVKVAPFSSPGLSTRTRPPWSSTTCFTTASSSPAAPYALPEVCAGGDTSKTCGRKSELIPFPLSITWIRAQAPARSKWTPTRPPRLDRGLDQTHRLDGPQIEAQLCGRDAREVEQVVDELRFRADVTLDRLDRTGALVLAYALRAQNVHPGERRGERGLQLVRDQGEELVLRPVRRLRGPPGLLELADS